MPHRQREQPPSSGLAQPGRAAEPGEQFEHGRVVEAGSQDALQRRVDLGEQAAEPVRQPGGLGRKVVVVADQDLELGQRGVATVDAEQSVRQRAGRVDHVGGPRVSPSRAWVQVGKSASRRIASPGR